MSEKLMNIVEAYLYFKGSLIILLSGLPGSGKTSIAKNIARDMKINHMDLNDYYKEKVPKFKLSDGTEVDDYYSVEAIDFNKFNDALRKYKTSGIVISGNFFLPQMFIQQHKVDSHLNLSIPRHKAIEVIKQEKPDVENIDMIFDELIFPKYTEIIKQSRINKFINVKDMSEDELYDKVWDMTISFIDSRLPAPGEEKKLITAIKKLEPATDELSSDEMPNKIIEKTDFEKDETDYALEDAEEPENISQLERFKRDAYYNDYLDSSMRTHIYKYQDRIPLDYDIPCKKRL